MDSIQITDAQSAAVAVAPRVTLAEIEAAIEQEYTLTAGDAVVGMGMSYSEPLQTLMLCILVMRNGFTVIGKSAPASPENFNWDLGAKFAKEDAIRQLWPLMGFALRDRLFEANINNRI